MLLNIRDTEKSWNRLWRRSTNNSVSSVERDLPASHCALTIVAELQCMPGAILLPYNALSP